MFAIIASFLKMGITANLSSLEAKRIVLTNFTAMLCIIICAALGPYYHLFSYSELTWMFFYFGLYYIGVLTISFLSFTTLAKPLLFFGILVHTFLLSLLSGMVQEAKELYIPILIIPFMIYHKHERWLLVLSIAIALIIVVMVYQHHMFPLFFKKYSDDSYQGISYTLNIICISCMLIQCFLFTQLTEEGEDLLQQVNTKLQQSESELQGMNSLKDQLLRIIAHDVRSPISSTQGVVTLLKNNQLEKEDITFLAEKIFQSAQHTQSMLEDVMTWSNSQLEVIQPQSESFILKEWLQEVVSSLEYKWKEKQLTIIFLLSDISINTDKRLLEIVLRNLLTNAIKYSFVGGEIILHAYSKANHYVLEVTDHGVGMTAEKVRNVFDATPNKSTLGTQHEKGTGVGLLICKNLLDKLNIRYEVESQAKVATTFRLFIQK
ncbi:MAG: HAMP domain-containing histidine kinase [Cytophagaceae bacterium]|jgi:hypothetical protein|nr:HAMP domain-containing histidine kinase [Cytophagaceae bacterium]